jgi:hypothetical protein
VSGRSESPALPETYRFLAGRPPLGELLAFVGAHGDRASCSDAGVLAEAWRRANDRVRSLAKTEHGLVDGGHVLDLPKASAVLGSEVAQRPLFRAVFGLVPADIKLVYLPSLVVFQKYVNMTYVTALRGALGDDSSPASVFELCLPSRPTADAEMQQLAANSFVFTSMSNNLRFLEAVRLDASGFIGKSVPGTVTGAIGLLIGLAANMMNVVQAEGRLVLNNGCHRAVALLAQGIELAPCVVQRVTRREELEVVANAAFATNPDRYLTEPRPAVLRDFLDPELCVEVPITRRRRHVKVTFGVEVTDVPVE